MSTGASWTSVEYQPKFRHYCFLIRFERRDFSCMTGEIRVVILTQIILSPHLNKGHAMLLNTK